MRGAAKWPPRVVSLLPDRRDASLDNPIRMLASRAEHGEHLVTMRGGAKLVSSRGYSDRVRRLLW